VYELTLDGLDKKILQLLSEGVSSYQDLARTCNVARTTVYRRIAFLQSSGIIQNTVSCTINLNQLDITPVIFCAKISQNYQDKAVALLSTFSNVRLLWRAYGDHNIVLVVFCSKGNEGITIQNITNILEDFKGTSICVSVGFVWEKTDLTPMYNEEPLNQEMTQILEHSR
jgi:DNA-binding Lrp family transcriptional regulator